MFAKFKHYSPLTIVGFVLSISSLFIIAFYLPSILIALSGQKQLSSAQSQSQLPETIELWWPQQEVNLNRVETFKGLIRGKDLDQYSLTWQLDDGAEVTMSNTEESLSHKESSVDVSGWTWKDKGPYVLSFKARDLQNTIIASTSISVFVDDDKKEPTPQVSSVNSQTASLALTPLSSLFGPSNVEKASIIPAKQVLDISVSLPAATSVPTSTLESINIWWPLNNTNISGTQPLKALLQGRNISSYNMYWQVDGGGLNELSNSMTDYEHKEALIDFSGWNWKNNGPYQITVVAKDLNNNVISTKLLTLYVGSINQTSQPQSVILNTIPQQVVSSPSLSTITSSMNPFKNQKLFVPATSNALTTAQAWQLTRPADALIMQKIGAQPIASWFGNWNTSIYEDVKKFIASASTNGSLPVLVSYNIPQRDCGGYSAGGADSAETYKAWIDQFAIGIGNSKAVIILEPDSLAQSSCLSPSDLSRRYDLLKYAVTSLKSHVNTAVYLDAGHSGWVNADEMAAMLKQANIALADGFALNVSNFTSTSANTSYGKQISSLLQGAHFVIDTSRNGSGGNGQWCNPFDQSLGNSPSISIDDPLIDAYLWIKNPGESDGTCNGGPSAGTWWPEYVLDLAKKAGW